MYDCIYAGQEAVIKWFADVGYGNISGAELCDSFGYKGIKFVSWHYAIGSHVVYDTHPMTSRL
jgi:hypothetical protein